MNITSWICIISLLLPLCFAREPFSKEEGNAENVRNEYRHCSVDEDIIAVRWNKEKAEYVSLEGPRRLLLDETNQGKSRHFGLRGVMHSELVVGVFDLLDNHEWTPGLQVNFDGGNDRLSRQLAELEEVVPTFLVRACRCDGLDPVFCPVEFDLCNPMDHINGTIGCFTARQQNDELAETCLVLATIWFGLLLCCVGCTECGRNVIHFLCSKCRTEYNEALADFLLVHRRQRASLLIRRSVYYIPYLGSFDDVSANESLALKTYVFRADQDPSRETKGQEEENLDTQCVICFQQLENGDRVGDLLCKHTFHADCLKTWLVHRNTCPLCNATDVASPYDKANRARAQTQSTASEDGVSMAAASTGVFQDSEEVETDQSSM